MVGLLLVGGFAGPSVVQADHSLSAAAATPTAQSSVLPRESGGRGGTPLPSIHASTSFSVTFTESGLVANTSWSVTLNGTTNASTGASIGFVDGNGTYPFTLGTVPGFLAAPQTGNATVANASVVVPIIFSPALYSITFSQTGLSGTNWSVNLTGNIQTTSATNVSFLEPNGTYPFSIGPVSGYRASPTNGSAVVAGGAVTQNISFTPHVTLYPLLFNETGLPPGTRWSVTLNVAHNSSTSSTVGFQKGNGTLNYTIGVVPGYLSTPSSGKVKVQGPTEVDIAFTVALYAVNFTEHGLPARTNWSVNLSSIVNSSTTRDVNFQDANGTYPYTIGAVPGYRGVPSNGTVDLDGASVAVDVTFSQVTYPVTWNETGLPNGTNWSATIANRTATGNLSDLVLSEPNGSYSYTLGDVPGFVSSPKTGNVTVRAGPVEVAVAFVPFDFRVTFTESGLTSGTNWSVTLGGSTRHTTGASLAFSKANGSYGYSVGNVPGFSVSPVGGTVPVQGADVPVALNYTALPPGTYSVQFVESGLTAGSVWSVTMGGARQSSASASIVFTQTNGSYPYTVTAIPGYHALPTGGTEQVNGQDLNVTVSFSRIAPATYPVTFSESGLLPGTTWSVGLNGTLLQGSGMTLGASEVNGSYAFVIGTVAGYNRSINSGTLVVNGGAATQAVVFTATGSKGYSLTFTEDGLPIGTAWSVTLNGTTQGSTGTTVTFSGLSPGSYPYTVAADGFDVQPASGNVTVGAAPVTLPVTFTPTGVAHSTATHVGLSTPTLVFLGAMGLILLVATAIALSTRERRRGPE
ncbi:MAG: hypothetical protein L3K10_07290 [Thermoplasmata archaeon]|nr:hypothetical protein [Thermoplasmata archaeon]